MDWYLATVQWNQWPKVSFFLWIDTWLSPVKPVMFSCGLVVGSGPVKPVTSKSVLLWIGTWLQSSETSDLKSVLSWIGSWLRSNETSDLKSVLSWIGSWLRSNETSDLKSVFSWIGSWLQSSETSDLKSVLLWLARQTPSVAGSVVGLVDRGCPICSFDASALADPARRYTLLIAGTLSNNRS